MFTSFPDFPGGPRSSSPPVQAIDDDSHRRRRTAGIVLNERGEPVLHWPDVIPDGWSVCRRITAMDAAGMLDSAAGAAGGAAMNLEDVFEALPRGLQRKRMQVEVDISNAADAFQRGQALRLAETLIRECLNIADMADQGHIPWDAGVADQGVLAQAARSAADYLRGYMDVATRSMGGARAATAPNGAAAAGDRAVSDQDRAYDAHEAMKRSTRRCLARRGVGPLQLQLRRGARAARLAGLRFRTRTRRLARMRR